MIDNLYNPDSMSKEDIKTLFVARQPLLDELVSTVKNQPQGAGVQHVLIIAPRGMGKTTMLLMLQFAIEDSAALSKKWQPIRFPEESYGVTELADFWLKVLHYLADAKKDETLETKIAEIEKRFPKSEDLREAAWATVKDWSKTHKKRIALMVDNFDMILAQINNDTEQARLRDILMNDGTVMLIGCAPSYFREIQDYGQPLYNFFKVSNLSDLKFADIEELLRRRAEVDEIENIEELLQKNRTRIKALEAFTGGNPRLVLMLYRIITSSDMTEVRKGLEKLLDAVTPYYKDKTEKLPPQQRKIIDQIAQYSLEKREGISPTEIAQRIRMTPNQVSSQLKRLAENGYVRSLNIRGRSSFYTLSEPLYAIWSQMRFGRNAREKRNWLVQILKAIYDVQEIQKEIEKLGERVTRFKLDGRENKVRGTLEYMLCLLETNSSLIQNNFLLAIESYLELEEISSIKTELKIERLPDLSVKVLEKLFSEGVIDKQKLNQTKSFKYLTNALIIFENLVDSENSNEFELYEEIIALLKNAIKINPDDISSKIYIPLAIVYKKQAEILLKNDKYEEANSLLNTTIELFLKVYRKNNSKEGVGILADAYTRKAFALTLLDQFEEAMLQINKSIEIYEKLLKVKKIEKYDLTLMAVTYFSKIIISEKMDDIEQALSKIMKLFSSFREDISVETITLGLASIYTPKLSTKIKEEIIKNNLEEILYNIILSINYLETKDEDLIEKLSPEVRVVVEETIRALQRVSEEKVESNPNQKAKNKKDRESEKSLALSK